ncbi:MAG TPA: sugar kinase [Acidimicrobiia bacterium]|jgi:2-dehydro-3-deoxygluconokinase|nr:sugar kinase [Acidimicrobiia bacterium]
MQANREPARFVGVGEMLLRATAPAGQALEAAETWSVHVGGAEANVAVQLARLGESASMVTWLPDNPLGWRARRWLQWHGVDTAHVTMVPDGRMGLYFTDGDEAGRPSTILYDRERTPIRGVRELPVSAIVGADGIHITGITALCAAELFESTVESALERSIPISYDCNYRDGLGPVELARNMFDRAAAVARWIFISRRDAAQVLGLEADAEQIAVKLRERFPQAVCIVSDGARGAAAAQDEEIKRADALPTTSVDGIGRGDALCAGFLWGEQRGDLSFALRCGVALAGLSQTFRGDSGWVTRAQLEACVNGSVWETETATHT